ncbi:MAG: M23 family metallopeptidase [Solirubrobacterales bacterium]
MTGSAGRATLIAIVLAATLGLAATALASGGLSAGGNNGDGGKNGAGGRDDAAFPIQARHSYGDGLGAGRGHEGQDVFAGCGKRIVAARPGRVRWIDYQAGGAGHYVVVKGKKFDYVYMHMLKRLSVRRGERVDAGERIGRVGSTGRASGCHLHFEMWRKPGWYRGGSLANPKPFLKRWDRGR